MEHFLTRTEALLGEDAMKKLKNAKVAVFGVGGVGGFVCEALARSGVYNIDIIDKDTVSVSNINRQIIADTQTIGKAKVEVMKERILRINPLANVNDYELFYLPETADKFDFTSYDYVIDAVDNITAKIELVLRAKSANVPIISSMGAANKLDPTAFEVSDIYKTSVCPLARVMRRELKKRGVEKLKVVFSTEESKRNPEAEVLGSVAFVPSVAGLIIASEVIKDIAKS